MKYFDWLKTHCGYTHIKTIGKSEWAALNQYLFTCAIITGRNGDLYSFRDRWCYHSEAAALEALNKWDGTGEPEGWHRHPASGRRREAGDPLKEYINP